MKQILDRTVLIIYCLGAALLTEANTAFLTAFLSAVICTSFCYYSGRRKYRLLLSVLYVACAVFCMEFILFFPVILYGLLEGLHYPYIHTAKNTPVRADMLCIINYVLFTAMAVLSLLYLLPDSQMILFFLLLGCTFAYLLQYYTSSYEMLYQTSKKIRDDSVERNLLLKEKNLALLEKQNYEIYTATLKERNRIAREIHDNVGHMLSRSILLTGALKAVNTDTGLTSSLDQLEDTLNTAMTNIRESVHDLHDESINLKEALDSLSADFTFCSIEMNYDMGYEVPHAVKYCYITIIKEALNNVVKHSNATKVCITAREHPSLYQLIIADNGTNIDLSGEGLGLINMHDRVDALNGTFQIQDKKGFRIFITIPKKEDL